MKHYLILLTISIYFPVVMADTDPIPGPDLDVWSACNEVFAYVRAILPEGKTILELGSGAGSEEFSKNYAVYSIEHNPAWLNKYKTHYIYAPIKNGWYDVNALKRNLPKNYDLIFVDGPPAKYGRRGFLKNLHLFKKAVPIIFDDVNRPEEHTIMLLVARILKRKYEILSCAGSFKKFGVILLDRAPEPQIIKNVIPTLLQQRRRKVSVHSQGKNSQVRSYPKPANRS